MYFIFHYIATKPRNAQYGTITAGSYSRPSLNIIKVLKCDLVCHNKIANNNIL